jgi:hypothetical protein
MIDPNKMWALVATSVEYYDDPEEGRVELDEIKEVICISAKSELLTPIKQLVERGPVDKAGYWSLTASNKIRKVFPAYDDMKNYGFKIIAWECPKIIE